MKLKLGLPHYADVLSAAIGILCVALLDLLRVIDIHDLSAGLTYNAVLAGFCYGGGGAIAMIGRQLAQRVARRPARPTPSATRRLKRQLDGLKQTLMGRWTHSAARESQMRDDFSRLLRTNG